LISPDLGPDARDFILRDVQAAAWVTHQAQANTETRGAPVRPRLNMDGVDCQAALADAAADLDPHLAHGDDIAFLLYSSGSTGHPKGVPHRHRDMLFCADTYGAKILGITTDQDRHFSASKLFFAYGLEFTSRGRCREPTRARSSVFACAKSPHPILRMPCSGRGPRVATTRKQPNQTML
jgi:benzoate-CoA ligase